jgi:enediyne biosynthesis protein E4
LWRNVGGGRFEDITASAGVAAARKVSVSASFADIDNDGDEDLMVTTLSSRRFYLYVNDGRGHFREEGRARGFALDNGSAHMGMSVAAGDYDHDGYVDLFTTEWRPVQLGAAAVTDARLLHNLGPAHPGFFEDVTAKAGVSLVEPLNPAWSFAAQFVDLDGDGWQDLAVTSDFGTSRLFWNRRDGTFVDGTERAGVGTDENGMGSTIADYDGDGRPDWFVTGIFSRTSLCGPGPPCGFGQTGNRLYRNLGNRRFEDVTDAAKVRDGGWGWGAAFLDATNSGRLDLVMAGGFSFTRFPKYEVFAAGPMHYWQRGSGGSFTDVTAQTGLDARDGKGLVVFDANGDGRLEVLVVSPGGSPRLFRNTTANHDHWLGVAVTGVDSNRDGIGAVVSIRVHAGDAPVRSEIGSVTGFLGESERTAHFGLGSFDGRVAEVRVRWPATGRENVLRNVKVDRTLHVTEPPR